MRERLKYTPKLASLFIAKCGINTFYPLRTEGSTYQLGYNTYEFMEDRLRIEINGDYFIGEKKVKEIFYKDFKIQDCNFFEAHQQIYEHILEVCRGDYKERLFSPIFYKKCKNFVDKKEFRQHEHYKMFENLVNVCYLHDHLLLEKEEDINFDDFIYTYASLSQIIKRKPKYFMKKFKPYCDPDLNFIQDDLYFEGEVSRENQLNFFYWLFQNLDEANRIKELQPFNNFVQTFMKIVKCPYSINLEKALRVSYAHFCKYILQGQVEQKTIEYKKGHSPLAKAILKHEIKWKSDLTSGYHAGLYLCHFPINSSSTLSSQKNFFDSHHSTINENALFAHCIIAGAFAFKRIKKVSDLEDYKKRIEHFSDTYKKLYQQLIVTDKKDLSSLDIEELYVVYKRHRRFFFNEHAYNYSLENAISMKAVGSKANALTSFINKKMLRETGFSRYYSHVAQYFENPNQLCSLLAFHILLRSPDINFFFKDNFENYPDIKLSWLNSVKLENKEGIKIKNRELIFDGDYIPFSSYKLKGEECGFLILNKSTQKIIKHIKDKRVTIPFDASNRANRNYSIFKKGMYLQKTKYGLLNNVFSPAYLAFKHKHLFDVPKTFREDFDKVLIKTLNHKRRFNYVKFIFNNINFNHPNAIAQIEKVIEQYLYLLKITLFKQYINRKISKSVYYQNGLQKDGKKKDYYIELLKKETDFAPDDFNSFMRDLEDVLEYIFMEELLSKRDNFARLVRLNQLLHNRMLMEDVSFKDEVISYPEPFASLDLHYFAHGNLVAYLPKTRKEVFEEGASVHHCIHSNYYDLIADQEYVAFFVREIDENKKHLLPRLKTECFEDVFEIKKVRSTIGFKYDDKLIFDQHRGYHNHKPPQEHLDFVEIFLTHCKELEKSRAKQKK